MPVLWDQHLCLPLQPDADMSVLLRSRHPTVGTFLSVNAGYAPHSFADATALLRGFRTSITGQDGLTLADSVADVEAITATGGVAVMFDLEDSAPLDGDLANLRPLHDLGVRTVLPTYNHANAAGGGCLDAVDDGLTEWGRALVGEMNAVGVVPDGSHCGRRTGLDIADATAKPMIYSHSCMDAVWQHPRNITDEQARECAATGGVVGITGVGIFLGPNTPTAEAMTRHLEYAVELIGIEHVGVSTDHSFDQDDFLDELRSNPELFDESYTRWGPIQWMPPETFVGLGNHLAERGWPDSDVAAVLGGNFLRVAQASW